MSQSPFDSDKFKRLKCEWYKKLKESGFEDIEAFNSPTEALIDWHNHIFQRKFNSISFEEHRLYYELASRISQFDSSQDRRIWKLHASGLSIREISKKLDLKNYIVHRTIQKICSLFIKGKKCR